VGRSKGFPLHGNKARGGILRYSLNSLNTARRISVEIRTRSARLVLYYYGIEKRLTVVRKKLDVFPRAESRASCTTLQRLRWEGARQAAKEPSMYF
jgi:hypothetical protein